MFWIKLFPDDYKPFFSLSVPSVLNNCPYFLAFMIILRVEAVHIPTCGHWEMAGLVFITRSAFVTLKSLSIIKY